jgi:ABC-type transporter Mla subunit MlaD
VTSPTSKTSGQNPLARLVGYAVVIASLVGLFLAGSFAVQEWTRPHRTLQIHFPEIATLSEGDPVVQAGVSVGKVISIRLPSSAGVVSKNPGAVHHTDREAVVTIELDHLRPMPEDTRFVNFSHSMMGARKVWVVLGSSTRALDESRIQEGVYRPGIAETMHRVDSLVVVIARIRVETERLLTEENPLRSPLAAARVLDSATGALGRLTDRIESARAALEAGLTGFSSAARNASRSTRAAEPSVNRALLEAREMIRTVEGIQKNLVAVMTRVEKITALAGDTTGTGRLLGSRKAYEDLEKSVRLLEKAAEVLTKDGLTDSMKVLPRMIRRVEVKAGG